MIAHYYYFVKYQSSGVKCPEFFDLLQIKPKYVIPAQAGIQRIINISEVITLLLHIL